MRKTTYLLTAIRKVTLTALIIAPFTALPARSSYNTEISLAQLKQSIDNCLYYSRRDSFPYYDRPEAKEPCEAAKGLLQEFAVEANRTRRNSGCSTRVPFLIFDLWKTQFLGSSRTASEVNSDFDNLSKNCYNAIRTTRLIKDRVNTK